MVETFVHVAPYAIAFSLPMALFGAVLLYALRRFSLAVAMTVLVLIPLAATLVGVLVSRASCSPRSSRSRWWSASPSQP
jgi:hypothetical protein